MSGESDVETAGENGNMTACKKKMRKDLNENDAGLDSKQSYDKGRDRQCNILVGVCVYFFFHAVPSRKNKFSLHCSPP